MTRAEIEAVFAPELQSLACANGLTYEETMEKLTRRYDGYHFNYRNWEGMFNPFSVLNTLSTGLFENAWFASGTPTFLLICCVRLILTCATWTVSRSAPLP